MSSPEQVMYRDYWPSMALLDADNAEGDAIQGAAFHIGDGWFVTAAHVITDAADLRGFVLEADIGRQSPPVHPILSQHLDEATDVGIFRLDVVPDAAIELGGHLDDWINDRQFILEPVLLMGYPPVPDSSRPDLIAVAGHINAVVDRRDARSPDFIVSPLSRGGFSGGPVLWNGLALGVVARSLAWASDPVVGGFTTVTSVEPIWVLLLNAEVRPDAQRGFFEVMNW